MTAFGHALAHQARFGEGRPEKLESRRAYLQAGPAGLVVFHAAQIPPRGLAHHIVQQPGFPGVSVALLGPGQSVDRKSQGVRIAQRAEYVQALPQQGHGVARRRCRIQQLQGSDAHGRALQMPVGPL